AFFPVFTSRATPAAEEGASPVSSVYGKTRNGFSLPIHRHVDPRNLPERLEQLGQIAFRRLEPHIANKEDFHFSPLTTINRRRRTASSTGGPPRFVLQRVLDKESERARPRRMAEFSQHLGFDL